MRWVIALFLFLTGCEVASTGQPAKNEYQAAVNSKTIYGQKDNLNQALRILLLSPPNSAVYQNASHVFDLLGQTPWGIYYAYQALKLDPRNGKIEKQLDQMMKTAHLPPRVKNPFAPLIRWHQIVSQAEKFQLLFVGIISLFFLASLWIWRDSKILRWPIVFLTVVCTLLAGSLLYSRYGAPLEGVLIKPAALYREPSDKALLVKDTPLQAGLKLEVLAERDEGQWLKVRTDQGEYGYIFYPAIRLID